MSIRLTRSDRLVPGDDGVPQARRDNEQWNPQALVVDELLAARQVRAVVGEQDDDRVLPESIGLQLRHMQTHLVVGAQHGVVVRRDVPAHLRHIRVLRRHADVLWSHRRQAELAQFRVDVRGSLAARHGHLPEERPALGHVAPMTGAARPLPAGRDRHQRADRVERRPVVGEVEIVLAGVVGLVAGPAEQFGNRHDAVRQTDPVAGNAPRPMVVGADPNGVAARDQRRARRTANGRRRIRPLEQHALLRQGVDAGRLDKIVPVGGVPRRLVVDVDPEDVRSRACFSFFAVDEECEQRAEQ